MPLRSSLPFALAWILAAALAAADPADQAGEWTQSLSGTWEFTTEAERPTWGPVQVPGNWDVLPAYATHVGKGWYRRSFTVPEAWKGRRIRLHFAAVYHDAAVTLNGASIGLHSGGYTPFEFDVTDRIAFGRPNQITVVADNTTQRGAWWHWGGISREVSLIANREARIVRQHISADPDLGDGTARITVRYRVANAQLAARKFRLASTIDGEPVPSLSGELEIPASTSTTLELSATLPKDRVRLWHFDHPNLSTLATTLASGDEVLHRRSDRFGIRSVVVTKDELLLNGEPVRLCGFNRVADSNATGNTEPDELVSKDVDLMKRANGNLARLMHHAQAPNLLDRLDEKGMLIFGEIPVWGEGDPNVLPDNPLTRQWMRETIERDFNHPCIIGWSVGNEILQHHAYGQMMMDYTRTLDPTRLVTYASFSVARKDYGPDNDPATFADLILDNDYSANPGANAAKIRAKWPDKAIFFSELGSKQFGAAPDALIPGLTERWNSLKDLPYVIGVSLWTYNDYRSAYKGTPRSGNREWGVVDADRRPKAAYEQARRLFAPVRTLTLKGREVRLDPRAAGELPSYTLRGYTLRWKSASGGGSVAIPELKPGAAAWTTTLPEPATSAVLVTPTGYEVVDAMVPAR